MRTNHILISIHTALLFLFHLNSGFALAPADSSGRISIDANFSLTNSRIRTEITDNSESITLPEDHLNFTAGYSVGAGLHYRLRPSLGISLSLNYLVNSISFETPDGYYMLADSSFVSGHSLSDLKIQRWFIPFDVQWYPTQKSKNVFLNIGYAWSKYIQTEEITTGFTDIDNQEVFSETLAGKFTYYNPSHSFLRLGAGYGKKITSHITGELAFIYNYALNTLFDSEVLFNSNYRIHFFQLGIQIRYTL
ncbi:MAG: outer membrane beta-barrel protein [Nitrosomonas sp.]|nr:outer membrane beta-barrel protein [Nitrosomonas sp.]